MTDQKKAKPTVLIVDDEEDFLFAMKSWLMTKGYAVQTANSGKECLEKLKSIKPDVVFLDVRMPEMDGVDTLAQLRKLHEDLPVFLLTAAAYTPRLAEAEKFGVMGFFRKSEDFERAAALIEVTVDKLKES